MKPYKSIFKESGGSLFLSSKEEAKQYVDISNLDWKTIGKSSWDEVVDSCPPGWRLPTAQELYTAFFQKVPGFQPEGYWSSSLFKYNNQPVVINFSNGYVGSTNKDVNWLDYGCYVKEINTSYEDKIKSLLVQHLKKNYNKSSKEIEAIEYFISSVLDDLEYTEFTMVEANKMLMLCKRFLGVV